MKTLKTSNLREMNGKELQEKLVDLRRELSKLNSSAGRGTLKKESGSLKTVRRNIARILTVMKEKSGGASE